MRLYIIAVLICILVISGCTSYDSCRGDCVRYHNEDYDAVYYECYDNIIPADRTMFDKGNCRVEATRYVNRICYDECRGVD
ncbi:hypothetical protein GQ472_01585 [archaeon]|nr:hypothetical protein [archaeon]